MTLRQALGDDAHKIQEVVDQLLDGEDSLILLIDGQRAISYAEGFGLSPCQLELLTIEIERAVRAVVGPAIKERRRGERVGGGSGRQSGHVADCSTGSGRPGNRANRGGAAGSVLRLAGKAAASDSV